MKRLNIIIKVCAIMGCILALTACGSAEVESTQPSTEAAVTESTSIEEEAVAKTEAIAEISDDNIVIVDQLGKTIEFDEVPQRVVTTIKPFPYIYYAVVGNNDNLVGCNKGSITAYEESALRYMYPELANADTSFVDSSFVVNVEEVLKLEPDVVFQWNYMEEDIAKMEAAGIKVVALEYGDEEDLETWIRIIGTMFNQEERAEELITYFYDSVAEVTDKIATLPEEDYSNIVILSDNLKVTGVGFSKYWIDNSGAVNPAGNLDGEELNVNMEQIYEWNPSIVYIGNFTELQPSDLIDNKLEGQDWSVVDAVQNGQVYKIPIGGYRWDPPGIETPLMIKWLAKIQHPELFEDMDMREEVKEFYQDVYHYELTDEILDEILGDVQDF